MCRSGARGDVWGSLAVAVNQEYAGRERLLAEGDEVALLPPVSGGCEPTNRVQKERQIEAGPDLKPNKERVPVGDGIRRKLRVVAPALMASLAGAVLLLCPPASLLTAKAAAGPILYGKDGSLVAPRDYREWIFLSSGVDMVYGPKAAGDAGHTVFDNVFVDPASYKSFLVDGTWPDKTVMVLEVRGAETNPSINKGGHSQGTGVMGTEIHLKDTSRFPGGWAFFDVNEAGVGTLIPKPATCYTCHEEHAAVDATFVQFYPTLLPLARRKGTLSAAYVKEFGAIQGNR